MVEIIRSCDQSCQTISKCDKSSQTISHCDKSSQSISHCDKSIETIINNKITPNNASKNFIENRMMRNYYRKRNTQTNILNLQIENESQRERVRKEIINEFNIKNNEVPKWFLGIKQ